MHNRLPEFLPDGGPVKTDIVIARTLRGAAHALLSRIGFADKRIMLVCDANTHAALGQRVMSELSALRPRLLVLEGEVHADEAALETIRSHAWDALVAVGGGTISDLCKYASFTERKPYAALPTAPSMNGYLSANASIAVKSVKESRPAHLPAGLFCDLGVLSAAPKRLIRSGLGDSLCRPTAQADWLLSHLVLGTHYTPLPFDMLGSLEAELFAHADKLMAGDRTVVELLLRTLIISGIGMTLAGGSHPASQGEHMIAHTMEMKHGCAQPASYHGEQIGVTTLTMAKIQQEILSRPLHLPPQPRWEDALVSYLGSRKAKHIAESARKKYALYDRYNVIASHLAGHEAQIRDTIRAITLPEAALRNVLLMARAPATPVALGWRESDYDIAVSRARFTRDRFTFLDLL